MPVRLPADHPAHQRDAILARLADPPKTLNFSPAKFLSNGHLQTIVGAYHPARKLRRDRERLELPDGDFLDVDWYDRPSAHGAIIFHGLGGSSQSAYVRDLQYQLDRRGWGSVAVNARGASGVPNRLARAYHAGAGEDIGLTVAAVLAAARARGITKALWHLIGFSLGGSMLINWWSSQKYHCGTPIGLCLAASIPFDLAQSADALNAGMGRIYQRHLLGSVKQYFKRKVAYLSQSGYVAASEELNQYRACLSAKSFWQFDDVYIAPLHGYRNVQDYYEKASPAGHLHQGQWPLLIMQAEDDPLVPLAGVPHCKEVPRNVHIWRYSNGGHVGFLGWRGGRLVRQLPVLIAESLNAAVR